MNKSPYSDRHSRESGNPGLYLRCLDSRLQHSGMTDRMVQYKLFSVSFSYPDDYFFNIFPHFIPQKDALISAYDSNFRGNDTWLYAAEYLAGNEFQRVSCLADIMGFYRAFGLDVEQKRPDFLPTELEFMHYLIFKTLYSLTGNGNSTHKTATCITAQNKFFSEHLYPGSKKLLQKIICSPDNTVADFYRQTGKDLLAFLESEKDLMRI